MQTPHPRFDLLILGGSGFVGARLALAARTAGMRVAGTHRTRALPPGIPGYAVDLCDLNAVTALLDETRPRVVVHCAVSYTPTSLDEATQMASSADSTRALTSALRALSLATRIVYVSTNAIFSGMHGPYREADLPDPEVRQDAYRFYGLARRAGEIEVLTAWEDSIVARTASVDGLDASGELNPRMQATLGRLRSGQPYPRFVDRVISPTLVDSLVAALLEIARPEFALPQVTGRVLHLAGSQMLTDFEYARAIAAHLGIDGADIREDHYLPPGAPGQYNIALDVARTQTLLRTPFSDIDLMLERIFPRSP